MRLAEFDELLEYSSFDPGIRKELKSRGYRFLGQGVDQMAFLEPGTGWVLKVFGSGQRRTGETATFRPDHKMFFTWAQYCMSRPNNPFLPKFAGFESFIWKGRTYLQIRQERLGQSGMIGEFVSDLGYFLEDYVYDERPRTEINRAIEKFSTENDKMKFLGDRKFDLLVGTLIELIEITKDSNFSWDLHSGNVMVRGRTPVIVDPWVTGVYESCIKETGA